MDQIGIDLLWGRRLTRCRRWLGGLYQRELIPESLDLETHLTITASTFLTWRQHCRPGTAAAIRRAVVGPRLHPSSAEAAGSRFLVHRRAGNNILRPSALADGQLCPDRARRTAQLDPFTPKRAHGYLRERTWSIAPRVRRREERRRLGQYGQET